LTAITRSHAATSISVQFVCRSGAKSAALFTSTSIWPKRSTVRATRLCTDASSLTLRTAPMTESGPCAPAIASTTAVPSAMSATTTLAPAWARASE
jgi:hypothetical protein